jgi:hypothetical protein
VIDAGGPIYSLNLGYGADDYAPGSPPSEIEMPRLGGQNAVAVAGLTPELTNFCASQNPLSSLHLAGLPNLTDFECYQCTNLTQVDVRRCPNLRRACLEQCAIEGVLDFSGDTTLCDIRGQRTPARALLNPSSSVTKVKMRFY